MTELPPDASPVERIGPGTVLRDWRVTRFLARGAYGSVFAAVRADDPDSARALKVFDPVLSWAARSTLLREFGMLRASRHPHLLRGEDAFDLPAGPFAGCVVFVLELAQEDLAGLVTARGRLEPAEVAAIGAQLAAGLQNLHDDGYLHGDVKPANVLRVGSDWKLGDFGVTTALEGSYAVAAATTLDFRPPELSATDTGVRVHRAADVWALGVTLWIAATGLHPYVGSDPHLRYAAVLRDDRSGRDGIDPALAAVLEQRCLTRDARSRATAGALAEALTGLNRPSPPAPPVPTNQRRRVGSGAESWGHVGGPEPVGPARPTPAARVGLAGLLGVAVGAVAVELASLLAAALPGGLAWRRAAYVVVALLILGAGLAGLGRIASGRRTAAVGALGGLVALAVGTGFLFFGFG